MMFRTISLKSTCWQEYVFNDWTNTRYSWSISWKRTSRCYHKTYPSFKKRLIEEFGNSVGFYTVGKKQIVYFSEINPCKYAVATLEGAGMRCDNMYLSFARMIRRHIEKSTGREPISFSELINNFKRSPDITTIV